MISNIPKPSVSIATADAQPDEITEYHCLVATGTWYYDHEKSKSPPTIYEQLLTQANREVCIWDPWIYYTDFDILTFIPKDIEIKCLTSFGFDGAATSTKHELANLLRRLMISAIGGCPG